MRATIFCILIIAPLFSTSRIANQFHSKPQYTTQRQLRSYGRPNNMAEIPQGYNNQNQFPMDTQVLIQIPMGMLPEKQEQSSDDTNGETPMIPDNNALIRQARANLFNLSAYLNSNNRPTTGTALTLVPLITLLTGAFQG